MFSWLAKRKEQSTQIAALESVLTVRAPFGTAIMRKGATKDGAIAIEIDLTDFDLPVIDITPRKEI